jgi:cation:H+ antiporter
VAGLALLTAAGVLLSFGADLFSDHASGFARRWRVHPVAIGLLLAGAEPEELVTALTAARHHHDALAVGDVIGANVTMLTLVVGVTALLGTFRVDEVRWYFGAALLCSVGAAVCVLDNTVSRLEGGLLLLAYGAFVVTVLRRERHAGPDTGAVGSPVRSSSLWALTGLGLVIVGGWLAVRGAELLIDRLGLGDSAVGLTFLALATSGELFALLWASRRHGISELGLAAVAGSVAANATASLGATALVFAPLHTGSVRGSAALACVVCGLLFLVRPSSRAGVASMGVLLVGTYLLFVVVVIRGG